MERSRIRPPLAHRLDRTIRVSLACLALLGCSSADNFTQGEGSLKILTLFVDALSSDAQVPEALLSPEGRRFFQKEFGSLLGSDVRARLLSPAAKSIKYLGLGGKDDVLGLSKVSRDIKLQVSGKAEDIDFEAAYVVRIVLSRKQPLEWQMDSAQLVAVDPTLANTSLIFRIYYLWVLFSFYLMMNSLFALMKRRPIVDPEQMRKLGQTGIRSWFWILLIFVVCNSWFLAFFPREFMSHFGFYWGLATCSIVMRQTLFTYNGRYFYGNMPGGQFLTWILGIVPLAIFLLYRSKFAPEQASTMEITFNGPPTVEVASKAPLRSWPSDSSPEVGTANSGARLGYLGIHEGPKGGFYRVVTDESSIAYLSARAGKLTQNLRTFSKESEFATELVLALKGAERHKETAGAALADIGDVYYREGQQLARHGSVRDYLEALGRYNEALKYVDREDIHLAKVSAIVQVARLMRHDNLLNAFGVWQSAAVSYNKTKALAVYAIEHLRRHAGSQASASDREGLISLAYRFGGDDEAAATRHLHAITDFSRPYARLANAFAEKDATKALPLWEEVVRQDPDSSDNFTQMGLVVLQRQEDERARLAFAHATALGPNNTEARIGLAAAWASHENRGNALGLLNEARSLNGYNSEAKLLKFVSAWGRTLLVTALLSVFFLAIAARLRSVTDSVAGTMLRVTANGVVFSSILIISWYLLIRGELVDSLSLKSIVRAFVL